ncbi:quinol:cytochrome c oxidoreductase quinone-binding subunit 2 [Pontibacter mucosus]|uniref:Quinol:cytochrome c oxidoreductase quinone-binding subunit 2 n=1 Tax=Pontibacter mucosus TaxID=1649266 RepID=A0A2T5YJ10_9BACT|nr:quinol:cytochrome C oxidoreductase [Pontibacter mucosus]PTX19299.1 quinol:cytochrome c oxidoreductase quinone-binding subunit 2 [Pontibacter mucosus]
MTEERLIISRKTNNKFFLMIAVGVVLLIAGIIFMAAGGGAGHGEAAGHEPASWSKRLFVNLWLNNVYFTGIALIGTFFVAVQYVAYAGWSVLIKRVALALNYFLPIGGAVMLVVFLFGGHDIFHWTHDYLYDINDDRYDPIIAGKSGYLNTAFFLIRMVLYFGLWIWFSLWLRKEALNEDLNGGTNSYHKSIRISAIFLVIFGITSSTSAWDWVLSIDTHWFSTMFGWYVFASWWVSGLAAITLTVIILKQNGYLKMVNANHLHDLGKFVFAFSIFWTYIWFSQFLLYWYANMPEEVIYFTERLSGNNGQYTWIFYANLVVNFVFPFLVLMTRDAKRQMIMLKIVTIAILIGHWFDFYLMMMPGTLRTDAGIGFIEIGTALVFLGVFLLAFTKGLTKASLVPVNHPFLEESVHHHV